MIDQQSGDFPNTVEPEPEQLAVTKDAVSSALCDAGLIAVRGPDADSFLQGQLTCDIREVTLERSLIGAYCSHKGRVLACLRLFRRGDAVYLGLPRDLVQPTLERLSNYVLRAKVTLEDAGSRLASFGVAGSNAAALVMKQLDLGAIPEAENGVIHTAGDESAITVIRLPGLIPRFELHGPAVAMQEIDKALGGDPAIDSERWVALEILAGTPVVYPQTVEAFLPQMLNLDWLGGISFQKGCYVGQEVVARTHYLGKLKRRMVLAKVDSARAPWPGDPVFSAQAGDEPIAGQVVDAARERHKVLTRYVVVAVTRIDCTESGTLHLFSPDGPTLWLEPLPYGLSGAA
ncbi:MAG: folate-binding protein [Candidatus Contendobacter sp.]|nr:folate-binding protein [Candidatus Contendobacter sp.]